MAPPSPTTPADLEEVFVARDLAAATLSVAVDEAALAIAKKATKRVRDMLLDVDEEEPAKRPANEAALERERARKRLNQAAVRERARAARVTAEMWKNRALAAENEIKRLEDEVAAPLEDFPGGPGYSGDVADVTARVGGVHMA